MDDALRVHVTARLQESGIGEDAQIYVMHALEGDDALHGVLTAPAARATESVVPEAGAPPAPLGAYLSGISVQNFRGIGPSATLKLDPGPGFTLVVGRNGSGKSSFAEGLEMLVTGRSLRWDGRPSVWSDGWRCLHGAEDEPVELSAELVVEGAGPATASRRWEPGAKIGESTTRFQARGRKAGPVDDLGWADAISVHRPFLSYNELGSMFAGPPTAFFDALSSLLGLEPLVEAQARLRAARLDRERAAKQVQGALEPVLEELQALDDDRARAAIAALSGKTWDLPAARDAVASSMQAHSDAAATLQRLVALDVPEAAETAPVVARLREAAAEQQRVSTTDAGRARDTAALLRMALDHHATHQASDCPVCGTTGMLNERWREATEREASRLDAEAADAEVAHDGLREALRTAQGLIAAPPAVLETATGLDTQDVQRDWKRWAGGSALQDALELADHIEATLPPVAAGLARLREEAAAAIDHAERAWRPAAASLAAWLTDAEDTVDAQVVATELRSAERWLTSVAEDIRNDRFAPIADRAQAIWEQLRQSSSVRLGRIFLKGAGNQRRVQLDVTVDGHEGAAIGVMSQGELNALALSLFLPRATTDESPFRFVIVDDPVQAMDPAKVDGLARVFAEAGQTRQVVVFTHDDRLPEAVRRLQLPARIVSVTRRPGAVVEVRPEPAPEDRLLADAEAIVRSGDIPIAVVSRVVASFCRQAIEARCQGIVRRRRLSAGAAHADVESALDATQKLKPMIALAIFDDGDRAGDVLARLNSGGSWAGDVVVDCDRGAHESLDREPLGFVKDVGRLLPLIDRLSR